MDDATTKLVTDAREAGLGVDDRPLGGEAIRITPNPGKSDVDYHEIRTDADGKVTVTTYGPNGQLRGTGTIKSLRGDLGLD